MVSPGRRQKLLAKARRTPNNLRFAELCALAEGFGWRFLRSAGGSHRLYQNLNLLGRRGEIMNFQDRNGSAKAYQVRQLVEAIDELIEDPEGN